MKSASARRVGRPPGPAGDPAKRRAELLDAASRAIRRLGPAASMDEIAAEAGLTKPILYSHFGDKAGLSKALALRLTEDLLPQVIAALSSDLPPRDSVRAAIATFIDFVEAEPDLYRFLVRGVAVADPTFVEQQLIAAFGRQIADVLEAGVAGLRAERGRAQLWSFAILGAVFAGAEWWLVAPGMTRDELIEDLTSLVWTGLSR